MTPQDRERLEAMSEALARMVRRQREMDERMARLERALLEGRLAEAAPGPPAPEPPPAPPPALPPVMLREAAPQLPAPAEPAPSLESRFGLNWISRIGAVTLILAAAFFFKYAFENHWITESGRVFLGVAASAAALVFGERLWRGSQRTYAQALTASGIAFLYLSFWAAFALYQLVGHATAFAFMLLTTVGAGALALRYDAAAIAVIGLAGGYLTPLLLDTGRAPWPVIGYALLLSAGGLWLGRRWVWLEAVALAGATMLYAAQSPPHWDEHAGFTLFALALYAAFALGRLQPAVVTAQVLGAMAVAEAAGPAPWVYLPMLAVAAAGLWVAERREWTWPIPAAFAGFWLGYTLLHDSGRTAHALPSTLAALTAAALLFLGWALYRVIEHSLALRVTDLGLVAVNAAAYFGTVYFLLQPSYARYEGLFAVAVAVVHMAAGVVLWERDRRGALLLAAIAWVLVVLAVPIQFSQWRVTMAWSLEAAALAWIGTRPGDRRAVWAAGAVFVLVVGRLLAIDSWMFAGTSYTALFNARFLTFAIAAACLLAAAWWTRAEITAAAFVVAAHFALAWGLCLEAVGWASRNALPENVANASSLAISVLLAVYAVALVAGGVSQRSALHRLLGIGLIGFVVLKLYLYDVWSLGLFYRMAAFGALGALLLAMSYLYSRYRGTIESWWRPQ